MSRRRTFKGSIQKYGGIKLKSKNGNLLFFIVLPLFLLNILENYWRQILAVVILVLGVYLYERNNWRKAVRNSGIQDVDKMEGTEFEKRLKVMFNDLGYKAKLTPHTDFGCDVVVEKYKGMRTAVQAKRQNASVGVKAIQEVLGSMAMYNCIHAVVITNNEFTPQARKLAEKNRVELWNRKILITNLAVASKKEKRLYPVFSRDPLESFIVNPPMLLDPKSIPFMEIAEELIPSIEDELSNNK